jgi:hypothetical protein
MTAANFGSIFGVSNVIVPKSGPKAAPVTLDFANTGAIDIDCELLTSQGRIEYIQTLYIDNADNLNPLTLTMGLTGQRLRVPARYQGYFPILAPNPPLITCETNQTANLKVFVYLLNVPVQAVNWSSI